MYWKPREAKKLHFDVIPRAVDEYLAFLDAYPRQDAKNRLGNAVWHIHSGKPPAPEFIQHEEGQKGTAISFAMLLNLAAVANSEDPSVLWGFLRRYAPAASPEKFPRLDQMIRYAVLYFRDFVKPKKVYRAADEVERDALTKLSEALATLPAEASAEDIQTLLYDVARPIPRYQNLSAKGATPERPGVSNDWFNMLYQVLAGRGSRPALRLLRRALRPRQHARPDRGRAGGQVFESRGGVRRPTRQRSSWVFIWRSTWL